MEGVARRASRAPCSTRLVQLGLVCGLECWPGPARVVGAVKEVIDGVPAQSSRVECLAGVTRWAGCMFSWAGDVVAGLCGVGEGDIVAALHREGEVLVAERSLAVAVLGLGQQAAVAGRVVGGQGAHTGPSQHIIVCCE